MILFLAFNIILSIPHKKWILISWTNIWRKALFQPRSQGSLLHFPAEQAETGRRENLGTRFGVVFDKKEKNKNKNKNKQKTIVNALTVKIESQHISRLWNTSVRFKRQHSILSSNVNKFSIQQTSVSSKGLIGFVFYRQIVVSRTRSY